jgi:hypothetical protein
MTRSHTIYCVILIGDDRPLAAFTVKNELISYLVKRNQDSFTKARVWRTKNAGQPGSAEDITDEINTVVDFEIQKLLAR